MITSEEAASEEDSFGEVDVVVGQITSPVTVTVVAVSTGIVVG